MNEQGTLFDIEEARRRRDAGCESSSFHANDWNGRAKAWLASQAIGATFTADDLVAAIGLPSGDVQANRNNAVGAFFIGSRRSGLIRKLTYEQATRVDSHARVLAVWQKL